MSLLLGFLGSDCLARLRAHREGQAWPPGMVFFQKRNGWNFSKIESFQCINEFFLMAQIINDTFGSCGTPGCQSVPAVGLGVVARVTSSALGVLSPELCTHGNTSTSVHKLPRNGHL